MGIKKLLQQFSKYYRATPENRTGVHLVLGYFVIPIIGMSLLYVFMVYFYL